MSNVKEQLDPSQEEMSCLCNSCYIVRYLIFAVLILLVIFVLLLGFLILVVVDYVSKWVEIITTITNDAWVVMSFVRCNIFCRFEMPRAIVSGRRPIFAIRY